MKQMKLILIAMLGIWPLGSLSELKAQAQPLADCGPIQFTITSSGTTNGAAFDNRYLGCTTWTLSYQTTGFSGVTLTFQSADGAVTPGTFGTYAGNGTQTGINPNTSTTGAVSSFANGTVNISWVRVKAVLTGSGQLDGVVYGRKQGPSANTSGGGGGNATSITVGSTSILNGIRYAILYEDLNTKLAESSNFVQNSTAITPPAAPSLVKVGTGTGTTWEYLLACGILGLTPVAIGPASTASATISGNATLDGTHSISITAPSLAGTGLTSCDVYRTTAGGTPSTTGLIGNVSSAGTLSDTGLAITFPFTNTPSGDLSVAAGLSVPFVVQANGSAFGSIASVQGGSAAFNYPNQGSALSVLDHTANPTYAGVTMYVNTVVDSGGSISPISMSVDAQQSRTGGIAAPITTLQISGKLEGTNTGHYYGFITQPVFTSNYSTTANVYYNFIALSTFKGSVARTLAGSYVTSPVLATAIGTRTVAYFNENMTGTPAGVGKEFSWYSEGGTLHAETGSASTVGQEIERSLGQTADLFRLLDSDGSTILSRFDKDGIIRPAGYKSSDGSTGVTVAACTSFKNGICVAGT